MYGVFSNAPVTTYHPPMESYNHCSCAYLKELKELTSYSQYISEKFILVPHMYIKQYLSLFEGLQTTQHC